MKTESAHALSLLLEIDRATMLRALRNVAPDAGDGTSRPTWKVSTAANALAAHRAAMARADSRQHLNGGGGGSSDWQDAVLTQLFAQQDEADKKMRALPTLAGRRAAAIAMIPLISRVDAATRERGKLNSADASSVDLRADSLHQLHLRGLEAVCEWTTAETWEAMSEKVA
jgi:hypothetical protein